MNKQISIEAPPLEHVENLLRVRLNAGWRLEALSVYERVLEVERSFFGTETTYEKAALVVLSKETS